MNSAEVLIEHLGQRLGTTLALNDGVCALYSGEQESAIIEIPPAGDMVVLHCQIPVASGSGVAEQMLRLNFDVDALRGCWLARDVQGDVRLCTQLPLAGLVPLSFVNWVLGFIQQVGDTRRVLASIR